LNDAAHGKAGLQPRHATHPLQMLLVDALIIFHIVRLYLPVAGPGSNFLMMDWNEKVAA
jgi:hypothetical protein